MHAKRGQAAIEFAVCVFAFALLLSAIFTFASIIPESTRIQSMVRAMAGRNAQSGTGLAEGNLPERTLDNLPLALRSVPAIDLVHETLDFTVDLDELAATYMFGEDGKSELKIREESSLPAMGLPDFTPATGITQEEGLL
ncbi:MAG: hypothetical protein MJ249_05860 [Kiritimatiellae bacterium]|nr:hypothetical protein [Kiritimatiellia bacterium]